jgi:hypothetical protein
MFIHINFSNNTTKEFYSIPKALSYIEVLLCNEIKPVGLRCDDASSFQKLQFYIEALTNELHK